LNLGRHRSPTLRSRQDNPQKQRQNDSKEGQQLEFDTPAGGQISVLGIRTTPLGSSNTLTTIPD
jgi:hypothetical protein